MRNRKIRHIVVLWTAPVWSQVAWSCSGEVSEPEPFASGLLAVRLQPEAALQLQSVDYQITRPDGFVRSSPIAVSTEAQTSFSFKVQDLQPGDDYALTVTGEAKLAVAATITGCRARSNVSIAAGQSTSIALRMQCDGISTTGSQQAGTLNECPAVLALRASPDSVGVGESVVLHADIRDAADGPSPLTYRWSTSAGTFPGSTLDTTYTCQRPGSVALNLTVSDGDSKCDDTEAAVYVTCTDAACLAAGNCSKLGEVPRDAVRQSQDGGAGSAGRGGAGGARSSGAGGRAGSAVAGGSAAVGGRGGSSGSKAPLIAQPKAGTGGSSSASTLSAGSRAARNDGGAGAAGVSRSVVAGRGSAGATAAGTGGGGAAGGSSTAGGAGAIGANGASGTGGAGGSTGAVSSAGAGGAGGSSAAAGHTEVQAGNEAAAPVAGAAGNNDGDRRRGGGRRRQEAGAGSFAGAAGEAQATSVEGNADTE
jgi:hypothetical protein